MADALKMKVMACLDAWRYERMLRGKPRVAAAGSIVMSCGALVPWTAAGDAGGSVVSKEFSIGNNSISDMMLRLGVPTLEDER